MHRRALINVFKNRSDNVPQRSATKADISDFRGVLLNSQHPLCQPLAACYVWRSSGLFANAAGTVQDHAMPHRDVRPWEMYVGEIHVHAVQGKRCTHTRPFVAYL